MRHAESLEADAVLLSGEAELMQGAWRGGEVVLDTRARNTRENARGVAEAARRLEADEVVVVTSSWHAFRARTLVRAAIGDPTRQGEQLLAARPAAGEAARCASSSASPRCRCSYWRFSWRISASVGAQ